MRMRVAMCIGWSAAMASGVAQGYEYLQIQHPQQPWRSGQGTIEQAVISIRPQGVYLEYGLYLTFSARGLSFSSADSVEVQFFFTLPKNALVHDLWLWVGKDIVRARLIDRWTASSIYEDIVRRRRDPAILFKNSAVDYELRIYPMKGAEQRKVKLTYLMPTQWSPTAVSAALPMNLLQTSKHPVEPLYLLYWPQTAWQHPRLNELPDVAFAALTDSAFGEYFRADVSSSSFPSSLNFALDSPMRNGIFLSRMQNGNEGIYQLALLPSQALQLLAVRKIAILLDYEATKSDFSAEEVLAYVKTMLHEQFTAADSFNLIFSNLNITRAGENWFAGDSLSIENAFISAGPDPLASYSNLPTLLANGIDFVKTNGNDGVLWLVSSSDQLGDHRVANPLINDLLNSMKPVLSIHIADFTNYNGTHYYNGGRYYFGNQYFYENLTRRTAGNYLSLRSGGTLATLLSSISESLGGFIDSFDLYTTLQGGFCFGRFTLSGSGAATYVNRPILQVGKFIGDFPFVVQVSGVYKQQAFSASKVVAEDETFTADSLAEKIWSGSDIIALESKPESNDLIHQIIDLSLSAGVLSRYTAFLALEPGDTVQVCKSCRDESDVLISVDERAESVSADTLLQAHPNPFNVQTTLRLHIPPGVNETDVSLKIYNMMGQVVRTFALPEASQNRTYQLIWDGRNDAGQIVATGVYYVIFKAPQNKAMLKLLMVK